MAANVKAGSGRAAAPAGTGLAADLARTLLPIAEARNLPAVAYTSDEVFRAEFASIFGRDWLCMGRAADVPRPGDYVAREVGPHSIFLMRGADGSVRSFYNVCRHRGSRLLQSGSSGSASRIVCPYHAWSYDLDGRLNTAPRMGESFCKESFPLRAVRVGVKEGLLFVNLSPTASALDEAMADLPDLSLYRMGDLVCARRVEYDVAANWKLICENYSECYHCALAHPQLHRISDVIARGTRPFEAGRCYSGGPMQLREGVDTMSMSGKRSLPLIPGLSHEDSRHVHYYVVYPNLLLSPHPDYVLTHTAWPIAAGRTRVVCEWLVTAEAAAQPEADFADVVEFWDVTNRQDWALCERAQLGMASQGFVPGPYQATEDGVHSFDCWYADRIAPSL